MKSLIALFLATLLLGSSMLPVFSLDQSAKWAEVLQHYQQHRQEKPDLGFIDFMAMHYGAGSDHQKHHDHSHQNLPSVGHSVPVFSPQPLCLVSVPTIELVRITKATFSCKADLYSFQAISALINPPRA
jgi:hypothetical protein